MGNFFTDVIQKDKRYLSVAPINDVALLEPVTRAAVARIIALAAARGVQLIVGETYRSTTRQTHLYNTHATQLREVGVHHYGLACDLWVEHNDHRPDWEANYTQIGLWAVTARVIWGGDWGTPRLKHNFKDIDHVQRVTVARQDALFEGAWYPDEDYDPIADLIRPRPPVA